MSKIRYATVLALLVWVGFSIKLPAGAVEKSQGFNSYPSSTVTHFRVTVDDAFSKPSVKRLKVENTGFTKITDFKVDDSDLEGYFKRYNGFNGDTPVGPWCSAITCPDRCGVLSGKLDKGQVCYIYLKATDSAGIGIIQTKELDISANGVVQSILLNNTQVLYVGGYFRNTEGNQYVAMYNGHTWTSVGSGTTGTPFNSTILSLAVNAYGNVYAGGLFTNAAGKNFVVKYDGRIWRNIGSGPAGLAFGSAIQNLSFDDRGDLYVAGRFVNAKSRHYVTVYDGYHWTNCGDGDHDNPLNGAIYSMVFDKKRKRMYTAGDFSGPHGNFLAAYDGKNWSDLGLGPVNTRVDGSIQSMAYDTQLDLVYLGGNFKDKSGHQFIIQYNPGSMTYKSLGNGLAESPFNSAIQSLAIDTANILYVAGKFTNKKGNQYVTAYEGHTWYDLGSGPRDQPFNADIYSLAFDALDNLYAGGIFTNKAGKEYVAEYDFVLGDWVSLGDGPAKFPFNGDIATMQVNNLLSIAIIP